MATEKWFGSHQTIVPLASIGDQKFLVAFRFEEWQSNLFSHRLFTHPIGDQKHLMAI
jgi:hypothetical protein